MSTVPNTRGSWTLDEAIANRWDAAMLDTDFRNEWPVTSRLRTEYQPLNDGEARPMPPGPYCVYEKSTPIVMEHMSSHIVDQQHQLQMITVQFTIHAKSSATESAKSRCIGLAKKVAAAFDPDTHPWQWTDDRPVNVVRGPDFHSREGDEEWAWVLQYNVILDGEYLV